MDTLFTYRLRTLQKSAISNRYSALRTPSAPPPLCGQIERPNRPLSILSMLRLLLLLTLPLFIADQVTKSWIVANFPSPFM